MTLTRLLLLVWLVAGVPFTAGANATAHPCAGTHGDANPHRTAPRIDAAMGHTTSDSAQHGGAHAAAHVTVASAATGHADPTAAGAIGHAHCCDHGCDHGKPCAGHPCAGTAGTLLPAPLLCDLQAPVQPPHYARTLAAAPQAGQPSTILRPPA